MAVVQFAVQSYRSNSLPLSAQRCLNMYIEREPEDAKSPVALFGSPGIVLFSTCGSGPVRALYNFQDIAYAVSGGLFYSIASDGTATLLSPKVIGGTGPISVTDNGTQISMVTGSQAFLYSVADGLIDVTGLMAAHGFAPGANVTFFDDYFVYTQPNTKKMFLSALLDGASFNGLDFASAESNPGNLLCTLNIHELLLLFTQKVIETWYDAGTLSFPFQRYDGGTIQRGILAPLTAIIEDNSAFFLGDDLIFYRMDGVNLKAISTHATVDQWSKYAVQNDAFCFSFTWNQHKFISLTFPSEPHTWLYDISSGFWHERESWDEEDVSLKRWRANCYVSCYGKSLVGDAFDGRIGYLSNDIFTEYGNKLLGNAVSPPIHADRKRVFMSRFELDMETGTGIQTAPGQSNNTAPQVMLDWSDDGGRTWSNLQLWKSLGLVGAYRTRLRWKRLGQARQRVLRINISDSVNRTLISAHADLTVGM